MYDRGPEILDAAHIQPSLPQAPLPSEPWSANSAQELNARKVVVVASRILRTMEDKATSLAGSSTARPSSIIMIYVTFYSRWEVWKGRRARASRGRAETLPRTE